MVGEDAKIFDLSGFLQIIHGFCGNQSAGELTGSQSGGAIGASSIVGMDQGHVLSGSSPSFLKASRVN